MTWLAPYCAHACEVNRLSELATHPRPDKVSLCQNSGHPHVISEGVADGTATGHTFQLIPGNDKRVFCTKCAHTRLLWEQPA